MVKKFECKYCGINELLEINDKEIACRSCGLLYLVHKSLRNDKVKYIPEEWD